MSFSTLHPKRGWSAMFPGGEATARKYLAEHPDTSIKECSIYRNGRFIKTIKREQREEQR